MNAEKSLSARPRIGVFGGAFDPPHLAHVRLAQTAIAELCLDTLYVVPTGSALHKNRSLSTPKHRLCMTQLAFEGLEKVIIDECELRRSGVSYTYDTVYDLRQQHLGADIYLIIGADQARLFDTWHRWTELLQLVTLAIAERAPEISPDTTQGDQNLELEHYRWHNRGLVKSVQNSRERTHPQIAVTLNMPSMSVSATQIRSFIKEGVDISHLVNPAVLSYITAHSLYTP